MSSAPREAMVPLTRWQYFTKTLYHNAAAKTRFVYNKVVYEKDETLQKIEEGNGRINMGLLLVLLAMFLTASTVQNIYIIVAGMVVIAAGELVRLLRLPKEMTMADITPIAHIETPFAEKFGVPRQSGVADCSGRIVFAPAYRDPAALRGLEEFSHIWLIWQFDRALRQGWSPTVRPPRLGGNARMGVFATRSPFRPNGLGLSSVVLERIQWDTPEGPVLHVRGADLVSGTPIFDIKPYLAYTDSHPEAAGGFTAGLAGEKLRVVCPEPLLAAVPPEQRQGLLSVLANDPRPRYQDDPQRVYGMAYGGRNVRFRVEGDVLTVLGVEERL